MELLHSAVEVALANGGVDSAVGLPIKYHINLINNLEQITPPNLHRLRPGTHSTLRHHGRPLKLKDKGSHTTTPTLMGNAANQPGVSNPNMYQNYPRFNNQNFANQTCANCGMMHLMGTCPVQGRACRVCGRLNHFARSCRSKNRPPPPRN